MPDNDKVQYTSGSSEPFKFKDGLLAVMFDQAVANMFDQQIATSRADTADELASSTFVSLAIKVPSRFVSAFPVGNDIDVLFAASLASALSTSADDVFGVTVLDSNTAGTKILLFSFITSAGVTAAGVESLLTGQSTFGVTLVDGVTSIPIYTGDSEPQPVVVGLDVVQLPLTNQALANDLPLSSSAQAALTDSLRGYINTNADGKGSEVLSTSVVGQSSARRAAAGVLLFIVLPAGSPLLQFLDANFFQGFQYGTVASISGVAPALVGGMCRSSYRLFLTAEQRMICRRRC